MIHESLATLRFEDVAALSLEGFDQQNVLFELRIVAGSGANAARRGFEVDFASSVGLALQLLALPWPWLPWHHGEGSPDAALSHYALKPTGATTNALGCVPSIRSLQLDIAGVMW